MIDLNIEYTTRCGNDDDSSTDVSFDSDSDMIRNEIEEDVNLTVDEGCEVVVDQPTPTHGELLASPNVGMTFVSYDDVIGYYHEFGRQNGFQIKIRGSENAKGDEGDNVKDCTRKNLINGILSISYPRLHVSGRPTEPGSPSSLCSTISGNRFPLAATNYQYPPQNYMQPAGQPNYAAPNQFVQHAPTTGFPVAAATNYQYPTQNYMQPNSQVPWSTGLLDCFSDVPNCCITFWFPCITFGQIANIVDRGSVRNLRGMRGTVRSHQNIHGVPLLFLLLLPLQNEEAVPVGTASLQRFLHPFLVRGLRLVPRVSRAQKPRLPHVPRMAREHGDAAKQWCVDADATGSGDGKHKGTGLAMYPIDQPPPPWQQPAPMYQHGQPPPPPVCPLSGQNQPFPMQNHYMHPTGKVLWSTGVCDCCYDFPNCIITMFCPCVTFGQIAEIVDHGSVSCIANGIVYSVILWFSGLACLYSCFYRSTD
ncbi:hypothetical protein GQ457_18G023160 [Hibiscus cannabinus]